MLYHTLSNWVYKVYSCLAIPLDVQSIRFFISDLSNIFKLSTHKTHNRNTPMFIVNDSDKHKIAGECLYTVRKGWDFDMDL